MFAISNHSVSPSARLAAVAFCALLATACHSGVGSPAAPSAEPLASTSDDEANSADAVSAYAAPIEYEIAEVGLSGYSGTCSLAPARLGFRLKAQGRGIPGEVVRLHLIMPDNFRTTAYTDVTRQGTFRFGQELVTSFPSGVEVRCVLLSLDGLLLAESTGFYAP
jgi:hypothetical protein